MRAQHKRVSGACADSSGDVTQPFCLQPPYPVRRYLVQTAVRAQCKLLFTVAVSADVESIESPSFQHFLLVTLRRPVKHGPSFVIRGIQVAARGE